MEDIFEKFRVETKADVPERDDKALTLATERSQADAVKFLADMVGASLTDANPYYANLFGAKPKPPQP